MARRGFQSARHLNAPRLTLNTQLATPPLAPRAVRIGAVLFAMATFLFSWWLWWTFQYGTFDLAFYVQALWLAVRGHWQVSLLNVPLMGNHAEPIVFLLAPLFALCPHPMLLVAVQSVALASMPFIAWRIARRLDIDHGSSILLALATILTPATALIGIYEFHPEALAAPLLLLMIEARLAERRGWFWVWFLAVLGVKENMALLLIAWCAVFAFLERRRDRSWLMEWHIVPGVVALGWLLLCAKVIGPWLNAGNVDYLQLYSHLGNSAGDILKNLFLAPQKSFGALWNALSKGNLIWGLVLPFFALPFFRPRWWLIAAPLLLQHLLSWRYSEWSLGAHYPAPFIPLFWMGAAEMVARFHTQRPAAIGIVVACCLGQLWLGPARRVAEEISASADTLDEREWKAGMLAGISPDASVLASQPFLSHLAKRQRLHSLHHVLKGLKTLSRTTYEPPPPTDVAIVDYGDTSTFNTAAGYYHPRMRLPDGGSVESSDRLLHEFLRRQRWHVQARNQIALFTRGEPEPAFEIKALPVEFDRTTTLLALQMGGDEPGAVRLRLAWQFADERTVFPWMMLVLSDGSHLYPFLQGMCAPETGVGRSYQQWTYVFPQSLPAGTYSLYAMFYDGNEATRHGKLPPDPTYSLQTIELGQRQIQPGVFPPDVGRKHP